MGKRANRDGTAGESYTEPIDFGILKNGLFHEKARQEFALASRLIVENRVAYLWTL